MYGKTSTPSFACAVALLLSNTAAASDHRSAPRRLRTVHSLVEPVTVVGDGEAAADLPRPICGIATEGVPAHGISRGCDTGFDGYLRYGYGYDGCSYNKNAIGPDRKGPNCTDASHQLFNIVDEPNDYTQAAKDWMTYCNKYSLPFHDFYGIVHSGRATTPGVTGNTGWMLQTLGEFFTACPDCKNQTSNYYTGTISMHTYPDNRFSDDQNLQYLFTQLIPDIKKAYPQLKVAITNFGKLGPKTTSTDQVNYVNLFFKYLATITDPMQRPDYIYYFAAHDQGGNTPSAANSLCSNDIKTAVLNNFEQYCDKIV